MTALRSEVAGCGAYLPARVMTNDELSRLVDTSDAWIVERIEAEVAKLDAAGKRRK